ncbi:MAG: CRISPR-associated endoribonuclease Cas6 [Candidatus Nitrosopolaris sp.]
MQYHYHLQGFIYSLLKSSKYYYIHNKKGYKFFCFSNILPVTNNIEQNDSRAFIISSPNSDFITYLYTQILHTYVRNRIRIGSMTFRIQSVSHFEVKVSLSSSHHITLITGTPITIRLKDTTSHGKTYRDGYYWRKEDPLDMFISQLQDNLVKKYQQFHSQVHLGNSNQGSNEDIDEALLIDMSSGSTNDFMLSLTSFFQRLICTLKKQIAIPLNIKRGNFNEVIIGTTWEFTLSRIIDMEKDIKIIRFMDGERNSLGFGFMNIKTR